MTRRNVCAAPYIVARREDGVASTGALTDDVAGQKPIQLLSVRIGSDVTMDPGFVSQLNDTCSSDPNTFAFLDPSPVGFDNAFYRNLQVDKGLLGFDQVLYSDMRSRSTVDYYASN
ncbi:peroxidase 51-like [Miscanthus floridulus]|uniref:peroxidase 51-like n=1 Tax=Miscanthus floridulus TaxID=154761 RepID=UPI003457FB09